MEKITMESNKNPSRRQFLKRAGTIAAGRYTLTEVRLADGSTIHPDLALDVDAGSDLTVRCSIAPPTCSLE